MLNFVAWKTLTDKLWHPVSPSPSRRLCHAVDREITTARAQPAAQPAQRPDGAPHDTRREEGPLSLRSRLCKPKHSAQRSAETSLAPGPAAQQQHSVVKTSDTTPRDAVCRKFLIHFMFSQAGRCQEASPHRWRSSVNIDDDDAGQSEWMGCIM